MKMSKQQKCKELRKQYSKWSGLTASNDKNKRDQATKMVEKIAKPAKTLTVNIVSLYFFSDFHNHGYSEEINKVEYSNATCFETSKFSDCSFNNGKIVRGGSSSGKWSEMYMKNMRSEPNYLYYVDDKIRYGVIHYTNGKYVGDLSSEGPDMVLHILL